MSKPHRVKVYDSQSGQYHHAFQVSIPMHNPPFQDYLEDYVQKHFAIKGSGFRFSCDQDLLQIRIR